MTGLNKWQTLGATGFAQAATKGGEFLGVMGRFLPIAPKASGEGANGREHLFGVPFDLHLGPDLRDLAAAVD